MSKATLFWRSERIPVASEQDLVRRLQNIDQQLRQQQRTGMVQLGTPVGGMWIGLGRDESVVTYEPLDEDQPYAMSIGDASAEGEIQFELANKAAVLPAWAVVPLDSAMAILQEFMATGRLSSRIPWDTTPQR